tara:strand:+ start:203 stop:565 length:363 start_codon:yes stop_codon:yes gene_type:complete
MTKKEHEALQESINRLCERFNITEKEYADRDMASLIPTKYDSPNYVMAKQGGDDDSYSEILYFDGDGGRAIFSTCCEIFEGFGSKMELHECGYCDFEWGTLSSIIGELELACEAEYEGVI